MIKVFVVTDGDAGWDCVVGIVGTIEEAHEILADADYLEEYLEGGRMMNITEGTV